MSQGELHLSLYACLTAGGHAPLPQHCCSPTRCVNNIKDPHLTYSVQASFAVARQTGAAVRPCQRIPCRLSHLLCQAAISAGFSLAVARWTATNLKQAQPGGGWTWQFDLHGIAQLYASYEATSLWPLLEAPPQGLRLDFVKAERSTFRRGNKGTLFCVALFWSSLYGQDGGV